MNAYSKDLKLRVLDAVDRGVPHKEVAGLFGVSLPFDYQALLKHRREGEDLTPKPSPGRRRHILLLARPVEALEQNNEATLERHCQLWEEKRGVRVSLATISRSIRHKLRWTLEKRRWVPPSETKKREVLDEST